MQVKVEDPAKLAPWFAKYKSMIDLHAHPPSLIFNMDRTSSGSGTTQSLQVLTIFKVGQRHPQKAKKASTP